MTDLIDKESALREAEKAYRRVQPAHAIKAIENAPAANRWISCSEKLPEIKEFHISDTVLCYCDSGALAIARLEENGFGQVEFNCEKDNEYHNSAGKVLYWMPIPEIPEPPENKEKNDG